MQVTVHFFARAKDLAGISSASVSVCDGATVGMLRQQLARAFPALAGLLTRSAIAVDNDHAADDRPLFPNCEVALLPPVSGG